MGLLTDYFAATDNSDANRALQDGPLRTGFSAIESKSLDGVVTMATLEAILTGGNAMDVIRQNNDALVGNTGDDGPWVIKVRESLIRAFGEPDAARLYGVAQAWAATDELKGSNPDDLYGFLWKLAHLSKWAVANNRGIYCWMSL
jgi:hypothetical protein